MFHGDRSVSPVGIAGMAAGLTSAAVVSVDGRGEVGGGFVPDKLTIYGGDQGALAVTLVVAGAALLALRRREATAALVGVIGLCAAQLSGTGLVAYRRWPSYWGCCSPGAVTEQHLMRMLAITMAIVCAMTAVTCAAVLVRGGFLRWHGMGAAVAFPIAVVVAVALPQSVAGVWNDERELAGWALMYSLPFAAALAVSALMERLAALALVGSVACSVLVASIGDPFIALSRPWGGTLVMVILAAVAVAVSRLVPSGPRVSTDSPAADSAP